jgi:co-chaperonin GroES (HSP10)
MIRLVLTRACWSCCGAQTAGGVFLPDTKVDKPNEGKVRHGAR